MRGFFRKVVRVWANVFSTTVACTSTRFWWIKGLPVTVKLSLPTSKTCTFKNDENTLFYLSTSVTISHLYLFHSKFIASGWCPITFKDDNITVGNFVLFAHHLNYGKQTAFGLLFDQLIYIFYNWLTSFLFNRWWFDEFNFIWLLKKCIPWYKRWIYRRFVFKL